MDITILYFLQSIREATQGIFDSFMLQITTAGESLVTFLLLAGVYWCIDKRAGQYMGFNVALGCTYNQFLKNVLKVERPWVRDARIVPVEKALHGAGGYSFPSGHVSRTIAVWGALGADIWKEKAKRGISLLCFAIVGVVAFSRNYLGVHTLRDVLGALLMGIAVLALTGWALNWVERNPEKDVLICAAGCLLCFLPMLKVGCLTNAGAGIGFLTGWLAERRFVRFSVEGAAWRRCLRFGVGGLILLVLLNVLSPFLSLWMASKYAGFFAMFVVTFFIMAVYPYFLKQLEEGRSIAWKIIAAVLAVCIFCAAAVLVGAGMQKWTDARSMKRQAESTELQGQAANDAGQEPEGKSLQAGQADEITPAEDTDKQVMVIGHRGYSSVFPENTISSFAGAIDIGTDLIELDVQMTKDGEIVVFHDNDLIRIAGREGRVEDYTLEELQGMDAGAWFHPFYEGEAIPTLEEALGLIRESRCSVYLELKDIGENREFVERVLAVAESAGMKERCIFASFNYEYLSYFKELDSGAKVLYNTLSGLDTLPEEFPADYYGLWIESVTAGTIEAVHNAGKKAFIWTVDTPEEMGNVRDMGADGVVTNDPGLARVMLRPEYDYLAEHYEASLMMPGLYGQGVTQADATRVVQGLAKAGNCLVVSAYSKEGNTNSALYLMNLDGQLQRTVDLGFRAHVGGVSYDEGHNLLWITGAEGHVYALSWDEILNGTYQGELKADFDAGLVNHSQSKVASFLTVDEGELYVGSYVDGAQGTLNRYDITDIQNPRLISSAAIPQRIQGITFDRDAVGGERYMLLTQGYQTEDSRLLRFRYDYKADIYDEPIESHVLPEGAEQLQMTAGGLYLLFESAARPYRATARIPNDRIYLIRQ